MAGMWEIPNWGMDVPLSSFQLLVAGGGLLGFGAILLAVRGTRMVEVKSSIVTEELMVYLGRIANALEAPRGPSNEEVTKMVLLRLQEIGRRRVGKECRSRWSPYH